MSHDWISSNRHETLKFNDDWPLSIMQKLSHLKLVPHNQIWNCVITYGLATLSTVRKMMLQAKYPKYSEYRKKINISYELFKCSKMIHWKNSDLLFLWNDSSIEKISIIFSTIDWTIQSEYIEYSEYSTITMNMPYYSSVGSPWVLVLFK